MVNFCDFDDSKPNPTNVCGITKVLVNGDNRKNEKKYKTSASTFTDLKKALVVTTTKAQGQMDAYDTTNGPSNVGGPGDKTQSVHICCKKSGFLGRLQTNKSGVDRKHGSYDRYLARKKGRVYRCQINEGADTCLQ